MNRHTRTATAALLSLALLVTACGDDDDADTTAADTEETGEDPGGTSEEAGGEGASDEGTALDLTVTDEGIEGLPESFAGGAVEVTVEYDGSDDHFEVNFIQVEDGTTAEQFAEEFAVVFEGGPFPDFVADTGASVGGPAGAPVTSTILLEPGTYIAFVEGGGSGEEGGGAILATLVEVTEGEDTELPEADGEIVASDYSFDVSGITGPGTFTFLNEGPDQFHHGVIVDFGTNSPEVAEEAIEPLLNSEDDGPPPDIEGLDMEQVDFDFAGAPVFGPGSGGTFEADFQSGNTYAIVCFISDRTGGPPHAIGMDMYEVFAVS